MHATLGKGNDKIKKIIIQDKTKEIFSARSVKQVKKHSHKLNKKKRDRKSDKRWENKNSPKKNDDDHIEGFLISSRMLEIQDQVWKWALTTSIK